MVHGLAQKLTILNKKMLNLEIGLYMHILQYHFVFTHHSCITLKWLLLCMVEALVKSEFVQYAKTAKDVILLPLMN